MHCRIGLVVIVWLDFISAFGRTNLTKLTERHTKLTIMRLQLQARDKSCEGLRNDVVKARRVDLGSRCADSPIDAAG